MSDEREGLQPIGGPRLRKHTSPNPLLHRKECIDPEDGSLDCVCGLDDYLQERADAALDRWENEVSS